jgi:cytochrome c553
MKRTLITTLLVGSFGYSICFAEDLIENPFYKTKCAICHGATAEGKEKLKTPRLKDRSVKSEAELVKAIQNGNDRQMIKMPPFKDKLTVEQIRLLVAEIKALK